jgi:formate hydrogenlyase subunit 3/multisubunit Na+/H+ antiporter MnhD subunit
MTQKFRKTIFWAALMLLIACAACCAIPIFIGAGAAAVAAGLLAEFAGINTWIVAGVVVIVVAVVATIAAVIAVHRRRCLESGECD